jgi:hypothetical protein
MTTTALAWALGAAWGVLAAMPVVRRATRGRVRARLFALSPHAPSHRVLSWSWLRSWWHRRELGVVSRVVGSFGRRRAMRRNDAALARELPVAIDLLGVAVGAGCTPRLAVDVAARWSPAPVAHVFGDVVRRCALGVDFGSALDGAVEHAPRLRPLADALLASDRLGAPVGPVLARLAAEDRTSLRRAAEAHARRIPVRLLFPLVFLVLPAFVLLTVVPGLAAGLGRL